MPQPPRRQLPLLLLLPLSKLGDRTGCSFSSSGDSKNLLFLQNDVSMPSNTSCRGEKDMDLLDLYKDMYKARAFELALAELWHQGRISGELHLGTGEEAITAGVGAAMAGLRPIVEIWMVDFIGCAMDAVLNHLAKVESFSGGRWNCPLVIRTACGGGLWRRRSARAGTLGNVERHSGSDRSCPLQSRRCVRSHGLGSEAR